MDLGDDPCTALLRVRSDAPPEVIKTSYRKLALQHHPNRGGDPVLFSKISNSYEILADADEDDKFKPSHCTILDGLAAIEAIIRE
jgi:curved DNA-binding protein CbpA